MESEKKYVFKFRNQPVELSMQQVQTIIELLDNGGDSIYPISLLELWLAKYTAETNKIRNEAYQRQLEQERKQEFGDD